jgi:large subunit ribosomal protein L21
MAFAIVETGGKQYRVAEGQVFSTEKLAGHQAGDTVVFDKVLVIDTGTTTKVGTPYIEGATVEVVLTTEGKGKKIIVQKFKSKSRYKRRLGHRQPFAKLTVKKVS